MYSQTDTHNNVTIAENTFTKNTIGDIGGGLYMYTHSNTHNNITIANSTFIKNTIW